MGTSITKLPNNWTSKESRFQRVRIWQSLSQPGGEALEMDWPWKTADCGKFHLLGESENKIEIKSQEPEFETHPIVGKNPFGEFLSLSLLFSHTSCYTNLAVQACDGLGVDFFPACGEHGTPWQRVAAGRSHVSLPKIWIRTVEQLNRLHKTRWWFQTFFIFTPI